jgi:thiol-disulfide isomerase/thioredoxin
MSARALLGAISASLLLAVACDKSPAESAAPAGRVVAVAARPSTQSAADFCDVAPASGAAPSFTLPKLADGAPAETSARGFRWLNLWATWCPPCIEELPLLRKLEAELKSQGVPLTLTLLSVDTSAEPVAEFARKHPEVTGTLRIAELAALEEWLPSIGLDRGATLPVHVFVSPDGEVKCARTGAIDESDIPRIKALLKPPPPP